MSSDILRPIHGVNSFVSSGDDVRRGALDIFCSGLRRTGVQLPNRPLGRHVSVAFLFVAPSAGFVFVGLEPFVD